METFCTSGPHSKYRAALTSSSFYQASPYSRNLRQNDYSLARSRQSTLLWHQRTRQNNSKPRSKMCSVALAAAAFMVLVTVLAIAGLALYMGALRTEVPTQLLTFSCSAKILRGDRFISHLQEKSRKYKQQLENLYHKSSIGPALVSVMVDRFGEDAATVYFKLSLNRKKLSRISNLEKTLRDILLNDSISRRPVFRNIRFDPRSVQIRQLLENDNSHQRVISKPKNVSKTRGGVLLKPNSKPNLTVTADLPVKRKPAVDEVDFKEEDLPVIQGSFHISKTEADITEKKGTTTNDSTTNRPKTTHKTKQPLKTTTSKETALTSSLYKIATIEKNPKRSTTSKTTNVPKRATVTSLPKVINLSTKSTNSTFKPTTSIPSNKPFNLSSRATSTSPPTSTKFSYTISPFLFTIPAHSLDQEPWVPIQKETETTASKTKKPIDLDINPTVSLIELLHQRQPIYTSFTNPGLSFHSANTETLGSTNMVGHPIPVNKIPEITEPSVTTQNSVEGFAGETEVILETNTDVSNIESREGEDTNEETTHSKPEEEQSEVFVEVETLKHVPGSFEHSVDDETIPPTHLTWELLNGTSSAPLFNRSDVLPDKFYNNTLRAVIVRDHDPTIDLQLKQSTALRNLSSIFENLASSLGIIPPGKANSKTTTTSTTSTVTTSTTSATTTSTAIPYVAVFEKTEPITDGNVEETAIGEGHAEVVDADEESLMLETQASTKLPLVTLIPVKSNSGVGRPLRPRPKRPTNITDMVENRSFPSDPFYKNLNIDISELPKSSFKFVQTEVVTSVSTEISKIRINKNQLNDFKILGVLNFEADPYNSETTTASYLDNETNEKLVSNVELIRSPKMDPKENFTKTDGINLKDEISIFSVNSSVSSTKNEKVQNGFNILTEDKLKQLSEISKLNANSSNDEKETVISNKAISASYTVNQAGFKILTKTFNKIPTFSKDEEKKSVLGFNIISLNMAPNKTECSNFTVKCGDGQCLPDTTRCNQLVDCNDGADEKNCNCADYLRSQYLLRKICDGVVDCWDFSDENLCEWCRPNQYVCANSKFCIDKHRICDGIRDCPNGDDERQCVTVAPNTQAADQFPYYSDVGYLMVRKHGRWGKLCMQNFEQVITKIRPPWQVADLGHAVCKAMTYHKLNTINVIVEPNFVSSLNKNYNDRYYELTYTSQNISKSNLLFKESSCDSGEVVKLQCQTLECGTRPQAVNQLARRMYRIVGGGNAGLGAWPWQAALYKEGEFQCGATLLSDRWLLSAGHCFYHSLEEHWVARLGALRRGTALPSPYEQLRPIIRIVLHPGYFDAGFINDISLLEMEAPIVFSDYVRPICLPPPGTSLRDGRICTVIGWGQLFEVGRIFPDTLQEVQVPVISTAECRKRTLFLPLYKVTDDMFCAGYERGGRDACLGDSGGPLMCSEPDGHWVLQGITSNGYGCARANRPGVYTKVSNYVTWIESYIYDNTVKDTVFTNKTTCPGHRCPLGECLPKSRLCNGFIECSDGSDEKDCSNV